MGIVIFKKKEYVDNIPWTIGRTLALNFFAEVTWGSAVNCTPNPEIP